MSFADKILSLLKPRNPAPLIFLRIAVPLVALTELFTLWPSISDIYGSQGYLEWVVSNQLFSVPNLPTMSAISELINHPYVNDNNVLYFTLGAYICSLLFLLLGYNARWAAFFAWIIHLTINNSANMYGYGVETFIHVSLFYLMFIPAQGKISALVNTEKLQETTYAAFWLLIIRVHLCIVYFNAGLAKLEGGDWTQGEAIWRSVAQPSYGQFDMLWLADWPILSIIATWSVLVLETAYPVFIWWKKTRFIGWLGIIFMHLGIGLLMGLHAFAAIMIVLNTVAFGWPYMERMLYTVFQQWKRLRTRSKILIPGRVLN